MSDAWQPLEPARAAAQLAAIRTLLAPPPRRLLAAGCGGCRLRLCWRRRLLLRRRVVPPCVRPFVADYRSVSYTHLTLPTNREV